MSIKYYWEDFPVGGVRELGERAVSADEVREFASHYDPQPFHVDEEAAPMTPILRCTELPSLVYIRIRALPKYPRALPDSHRLVSQGSQTR